MDNPPKRPRQNRTITVDFNNEQTYHRLCGDGPCFIDFVVALECTPENGQVNKLYLLSVKEIHS